MKYEAKNAGSNVPISQASGAPWVSIPQTSAIAHAASTIGCTGCHLITEAEWLTIAHNVLSVSNNWSGGSVGSGYIYSGHNDNDPTSPLAGHSNDSLGYHLTNNTSPDNQLRTLRLTTGEFIWDFAGNVSEWTQGQTSGGQPGLIGDSGDAWKQWNTANILGGGFLSVFPAYGTSAADGWTSAQGIGRLYSNYNQSSVRGFARGNDLDSGASAGVLTLRLNYGPSSTSPFVGFRVAR